MHSSGVEVPIQIGFKCDPPKDLKPCRWFQVGKCFQSLTTHFEHKSVRTEDKIRLHICQHCYEVFNRVEQHPGFQCPVLAYFDEVCEKATTSGSGSEEPTNKKTRSD